jgi:hypothetical protein
VFCLLKGLDKGEMFFLNDVLDKRFLIGLKNVHVQEETNK